MFSFVSRKFVVLGATGVITLATGLAMTPTASADTQAPASEANALGLRLDPIIDLSGTHAKADGNQGSATANVLQLLGSTPLPQLGGSAAGNATSAGNLVDTGAALPIGRVAVAPWSASATSSPAHRHADAAAALLSLVLVNDSTFFANVLGSHSTADHDNATNTSKATSSSDGAVVGVGGALTLDVLHSEASTEHGASSYLLGINDTHILTNDQVGSLCSLALPPVLSVACLNVIGGIGTDNGASILDGSILGMVFPGAIQPSTKTGARTVVDGGSTSNAAPKTSSTPAVKRSNVRGATGGRLPRTGSATIALAAFGLLMTALGLAAVAMSRIRTAAAIA